MTRPVKINGHEFLSLRAAASHFSTTTASVQRYLKTGRAVFMGNAVNRTPVVVRGVSYPSQSAAARALGISQVAICNCLERHGSLETVGLRLSRPKEPIRIRGVKYPSHTAAAKTLGVSCSAISAAKRYARLESVGLQKRHLAKANQ